MLLYFISVVIAALIIFMIMNAEFRLSENRNPDKEVPIFFIVSCLYALIWPWILICSLFVLMGRMAK